MQDLGLLDTDAEGDFDRYTRLATDLLGVPVSLFSLIAADRTFLKSQSGLPEEVSDVRTLPLSHSLCQHAVTSKQPFVVSDARKHPLVADNLAVRDLGVVAYAGMPLLLSDGHAVGAFCAIDREPRVWSERDIHILGDLAAAVTAHLELRRALAQQSLHDRLTQLPNRFLLCTQTDQLLRAAGPAAAGSVAVICLGLDDFRLVNEAYGADTADRVLREVSEHLALELRSDDMLGRLSGDVFAVVGRGMGDEGAALRLAGRLRRAVSAATLDIEGRSIEMTATLGVAMGTASTSGADLLARADDAMRRSKASGRGVRMAVLGGAVEADAQLRLRTALGGALARSEISVVYQPIVDLANGIPVGFEALARWNSLELGQVPPCDFIPVAERTGDIVRIGEWVLRAACAQLAQWRDQGADLSMSVNVAPLQLELANLAQVVANVLTEHDFPPDALVVEITEGVLIGAGTLQSRRNLDELRELGVRIALDDFGTGYSALGYLKRFPIDMLKIDRSFVEGLECDSQAAELVQAFLALARGLGLQTVVEGIETVGQWQLLEHLGCSLGQGYLFARPRPAEQISIDC